MTIKRSAILLIVCSLLVGFISVAQQFLAIHNLGGGYKGMHFLYGVDNADIYLAKIKEIYDGHLLIASPYFFEYKSVTPLVPPLGEYIYAAWGAILKLPLDIVGIVCQFIFPVALFLLVYYLIINLSNVKNSTSSSLGAIAGGLLVVLGYDFIDFRFMYGVLTKGLSTTHSLVWDRPVNPITGAVLIMFFLLCLHKVIKSQRVLYIIAAGLSLSVMIGYYFSWFISLTTAGSLLLIYALRRNWTAVKKIFWVIIISILATSWYWYRAFFTAFNNQDINRAGRNGALYNHDLVINKTLAATLIIFLILFFYNYYTQQKKNGRALEDWWWFCMALLAGSVVAFNQQVITGVNIWHHHFVQYTIPIVYIVMMVLINNLLRPFSKSLWWCVVVVVILSTVSYGLYISSTYTYSMPDFRSDQNYMPVFSWLNKNAEKDCVVLAKGKDDRLERLLPVFSYCNTYMAPSGYDLEAPPERRMHDFLVYLRINKVKVGNLDVYLRTNFFLVNQFFFENWDQLYSGHYGLWMEPVIDNIVKSYNDFYKDNFMEELQKYKINYVLSDEPLNTGEYDFMSLAPVQNFDGIFLYKPIFK